MAGFLLPDWEKRSSWEESNSHVRNGKALVSGHRDSKVTGLGEVMKQHSSDSGVASWRCFIFASDLRLLLIRSRFA